MSMARPSLLPSLVLVVVIPFGKCIPCGGPVPATSTVVQRIDTESIPKPTLALPVDDKDQELKRRSFCYPNVYDPSCTPLIPASLSISPYPTISFPPVPTFFEGASSASASGSSRAAYSPLPAEPSPSPATTYYNPFVVPKSSSSSDGVNWSVPTPNPDPEEFSSDTSDTSRVRTSRRFPRAAIAGIAVGAAAVIGFFSTVCCCCFRKKQEENQPQAAGLLATKDVEPLPSPSANPSPYSVQTPHSYDQATGQGYPFPQTSPPMSNSPMTVQRLAPYSPSVVSNPTVHTPEYYQQHQPLLQQQDPQYSYQPPISATPPHTLSPSIISAQSPHGASVHSFRPYEGT